MAVIEIDLIDEGNFGQTLATLGPRGLALVQRVEETRLKEAVSFARTTRLSGGGGGALHPRSGDLRNSFWYEIKAAAGAVMARLGFIRGPTGGGQRTTSPLRYSWTHEYGATIRAKSGGYLRVPTDEVLTPAGRYKAKYNVVSAREIPNTFIRRAASGSLGIYEVRRGRAPVRLFHLVREVTIPARPVLRPTWFIFKPLILNDIRVGLARLGGR
jgi:hypothetical protein